MNTTIHDNFPVPSKTRRKVNLSEIHRRIRGPVTQPTKPASQLHNPDPMRSSNIEVIPEYEEALHAVLKRRESVFGTGYAGTGKSTMIAYLRSRLPRSAIVAPTAAAALNIGGTTLHSFFGIPPRTVNSEDVFEPRIQMGPVIANLDALIIDEVSMDSPNLIDCISNCLCAERANDAPFGGVPVVFIGDLFQLPPVITDDAQKKFFIERYGGCYFFAADVFKKLEVKPIQLTKPFRQQDPIFVGALNDIRTGNQLDEAIQYFNDQCIKTGDTKEGTTTHLVPTKRAAERVNRSKLEEIPEPGMTYHAEYEGRFKYQVSRLPAPERLTLKRGARVVFVKNSPPNWTNGTGGVVVEVGRDSVRVVLDVTGGSVWVGVETWEDIEYFFNREKNKIEHTVVGTFTQLPLILGWAVTIHKSQGMTLDSVRVDLGDGAFCAGQTYVALSRARTIKGLTLARAIGRKDVKVDRDVLEFYRAVGFFEG